MVKVKVVHEQRTLTVAADTVGELLPLLEGEDGFGAGSVRMPDGTLLGPSQSLPPEMPDGPATLIFKPKAGPWGMSAYGLPTGAGVFGGLVPPIVNPRRYPNFGAGPGEVAGARFGASLTMGTGLEGLNGRSYRTERVAMVPKAWDLAQSRGYGFIKAPPFSGKTAFIQQVLNFAEAQGWRAFYFNCSRLKEFGLRLDEALRAACGGTLSELMEGAVASDDDCRLVLAVDEAQLLYNTEGSGSNQFFTALKRLDPSKCNVRLLIAAAYGAGASSDSQTSRPESPVATPGDIDTSESITIYPGRVSLQLDPEDVDELWCAWTAAANLQLEDMVRDRIAAMCASQVGLMVFCFDFLSKNIVNTPPNKQTQKALNLLASTSFYTQLSLVRSMRRPPEDVMEVLQELLWRETMPVHGLDSKFVRRLASYGQAYEDPSQMLRLTSPLHKANLLWRLYGTPDSSSKLPADVDVLGLLSRIVERMDPDVLRHTLSLGAGGLILERCWQMEFYRVCSSLLRSGAAVSPDVGQALGGNGYMDFFISDPYCVGLELTREGSCITEHLGRFLNPDKYRPMLENGSVQKHAVVDFRTQGDGHRFKTDPHLYTVLFEQNFTQATIWNQGSASRPLQVHGTATGNLGSAAAAAAAEVAAATTMAE